MRVVSGPFLNREYLQARGEVLVRVRCLLSPALMLHFTGRHVSAAEVTSLRFRVEGAQLIFVSTSDRKKSSAEYRRARKKR